MATVAPRRRHAAWASDSVSRPGTKNTWPGDQSGSSTDREQGWPGRGGIQTLREQNRRAGEVQILRSGQAPPPWARRWLVPPLTCQRRGEAEGVVAVALPVAGPVAADAGPTSATARSARREHWVAHGALEQPARVTPVQTLGPRWREMAGMGGDPEIRGVTGREFASAGVLVTARRASALPSSSRREKDKREETNSRLSPLPGHRDPRI